ncbi:MAG: phosphatase PAP2 family protein [Bacteroidota bacterium]
MDFVLRGFPIVTAQGRGRNCLSLFCLLLAVDALLSTPLTAQLDPDNLDVRVFRSINNSRSSFLDHFVDAHDHLALGAFFAVPLSFATHGVLAERKFDEDTGVVLVATEAGTFLLTTALKVLIQRERPSQTLRNVRGPHLSSVTGYSFPSIHAAISFAIATTLSYRYPRPAVYLPSFLWATLVGYGRIYLGVHYPSDVLVGAAIGIAVAMLLRQWEADLLHRKDRVFGRRGVTSSLFC